MELEGSTSPRSRPARIAAQVKQLLQALTVSAQRRVGEVEMVDSPSVPSYVSGG